MSGAALRHVHTEIGDRDLWAVSASTVAGSHFNANKLLYSSFYKSINDVKRSVTFSFVFYCILGGNYILQSNLQSWVFSKVSECVTDTCKDHTRKWMASALPLEQLLVCYAPWFNPQTSQPSASPSLTAHVACGPRCRDELHVVSSQPRGAPACHRQPVARAVSRVRRGKRNDPNTLIPSSPHKM